MQRLCQVFGVHRSSYRAWRDRDRTPCEAEQELQEQVVEAYKTSKGSAGARTIASMVTQAGIPLSRYPCQPTDEAVGAGQHAAAKPRLQEGRSTALGYSEPS